MRLTNIRQFYYNRKKVPFQTFKRLDTENLLTHPIISFDTETYSDHNKVMLTGIYDGSKEHPYSYYTDKEEAIKSLLSAENIGKRIFATNLQFDFNGLFTGSKQFADFKPPLISGSRLLSMTYPLHTGNIVFLDSGNFAQFSVKEMGKILKLPKLSDDVKDMIGKKPKTKDEWDRMIAYNERDCKITYDFMSLLQKGFNDLGGEMKTTISSTALDIYKRKYLRFNVKHEDYRLYKDYRPKIFQSYFGGRCEVYGRGLIKNKTVYDVNSLYPSVMLEEFPVPESAIMDRTGDKSLIDFEGVSNVVIECPKELNIPLLPYHDEQKKKLIFPIGKIVNKSYTNVELRKAVYELGYKLIRVNWTLYYKRTFPFFREYVEDLYAKRNEYKSLGDARELVMKLCMNSTYGKFGQHTNNEFRMFDIENLSEEDLDFTEQNVTKMQGTGRFQYFTKEGTCTDSFVIPIFPTYVTSYARCKMYDYIVKYKADYTDTDSIITHKEIPTSNKIGDMKAEAFIRKGIIIKPKLYEIITDDKTKIKVKGVSKVDAFMFQRILAGQSVRFRKFMKMKESMKRGFPMNMIVDVDKQIDLEDNKRVWMHKFSPYQYDIDSRPPQVM